MKANPETGVAKAMTGTLQMKTMSAFHPSDFLTPHQLASYFSRISNLSPFNDE